MNWKWQGCLLTLFLCSTVRGYNTRPPIEVVTTNSPGPRPGPFDRKLALSFIIARSGEQASSDECLAAVAVNGTEYTAPASTPCSLADAMDLCSQMTAAGAFEAVANEWALEGSFGNASADGCEFLFYTESVDDEFDVNDTSALSVAHAFDFEAALYPWQYSWNSQLRSELNAAGGVMLSRAVLNAKATVLQCDQCYNGSLALFWLHALVLRKSETMKSVVRVAGVSHAVVHLGAIAAANGVGLPFFDFQSIDSVDVSNGVFEWIHCDVFRFSDVVLATLEAVDFVDVLGTAYALKASRGSEVHMDDISFKRCDIEAVSGSRIVVNDSRIVSATFFAKNAEIDVLNSRVKGATFNAQCDPRFDVCTGTNISVWNTKMLGPIE